MKLLINSRKNLACLIQILSLFICSVLGAASNPYGTSDELDRSLKTGFQQLFDSQFLEAEKTFSEMKPTKKELPLSALAKVVLYWWEISSQVMEGDETASQRFLDAAEACMRISSEAIDAGDNRGIANFAMGTTLGLMSRWSAANRAWIPAYFRGSKAVNYLEKALAKNRRLYDAYMCMGTFNYARELIQKRLDSETLDPDDRGKLSLGLEQLNKAFNSGTYFRQASGLMLAGILANDDPARALPILEQLRVELPNSAFVHMVLITALYNAQEMVSMEKETDEFFHNVTTGTYSENFKPQAHFAKGLIAFRNQDWKMALEEFGAASRPGNKQNPYVTWAHLYQGYAYDAAGQRKKAREKYQLVLKLPRRFASHDHARERLGSPFKPTDVEMKRLEVRLIAAYIA